MFFHSCAVLVLRPAKRFLLLAAVSSTILVSAWAVAAEHVIHISVDGLNASVLQSLVDAGQAPTFKRLQNEGAWTMNARTDYFYTNTLPNHATMFTGRPVLQPEGIANAPFHNWTSNKIPRRGTTLHQTEYIPSVFDVVHDAGGSTALFGSKDKFVLFDQSYDETNGAAPRGAVSPKLQNSSLGETRLRGRDKVDTFFAEDDGPPRYSQTLNERFLAEMRKHRFNYAFVHYRDPDSVGHVLRWGSSVYRWAIRGVDAYLGDVLHLIDADPQLKGRTSIILSTDHGGTAFGHNNPELKENYTIPVLVWGAGVTHAELYALNRESRKDPGEARIDYSAEHQPIRNGDTGNLALSLLGLGPIPTSMINVKQDLCVALPGDFNLDGTVDAADEVVWKKNNGSTTNLQADGNHDRRVDEADYDLWRKHFGETVKESAK